MAMVNPVESNQVYIALEKHLNDLEINTKSKAINEKDMLEVSKKAYKSLKTYMKQEKGLNTDFRDLILNCIRGKFYSPFGIVKDLEEWSKHPVSPLDSRNYTWYDLCTANED